MPLRLIVSTLASSGRQPMSAKLKTRIFGNDVKKMVKYEEVGAVRNGKLEERKVGGGKKEKMEIDVISPDEIGNSEYEFILYEILATCRR